MIASDLIPVRVVVLSPHLDDAALSAWHAAAGAGESTVVVSVFAGVPEDGFVSPLDRAHGAHESAEWMRRRRREDAEVLAPGASTVHLDGLDLQYRIRSHPDLERTLDTSPSAFLRSAASEQALRITPGELERIVPHIDPDTVVYGPLGVGGHPDHMDVAAYAVLLRDRVREVRLFADTPYYLHHGLPTTAGGGVNAKADELISQAWAQLLGHEAPTLPTVVELDDSAVARKIEALRGYSTEFRAIDEDFGGVPSDPRLMRHELYWTLR